MELYLTLRFTGNNMSPIHVVCLKWGTKFTPDYVNNLFASIRRHSTIPILLHCFTDNSEGIVIEDAIIHKLPENGIHSWWNKLYLFSKELPIPLGEKIVFFDLDTLVTNNIDDILLTDDSTLVGLRDFYTGIVDSVKGTDSLGSGFMVWKHGSYSHIWTRFMLNPQRVIKSIHPAGDQVWIQMNTPDRRYWQDLHPDKVVSFKVHCRNGLPADAAVVCYHGKPSIPDSITTKSKSWKWILEPAAWVADHWRM